ncbi:MAG: hypothetical protein Q9186_006870 [Xanthomendoza sp. 1 TL-2023]
MTTPTPRPTLPDSQTKYINGTTTVGPFSPPTDFDLGNDELISRMLADDLNSSIFDASFTDVPHEIASISLDGSGLVDAPAQFVSVLPGANASSRVSSRSATADVASPWGVGGFRSDFSPSYRPAETASLSATALTSLDTPPPQSASNTRAVSHNLIPPNTVPTRTLPRSPTSPTAPYPAPSCQNCTIGTNTSSAFRDDNLLSGCIWRHPIHTAAQSGYTRIIQLLLQSGCDVNLKDGTGSTPLHVSAAEGHAEVVRLLVNHGSDVDAMDNLGWTPIHLATRNGHTDCVELLLRLGP